LNVKNPGNREPYKWLFATGVFSSLILVSYSALGKAPPWDFWGGYLSAPQQWWTLGSFFSPVEYFPYLAGGYPAYLDIQSSSWYLPVGALSIDGFYSPSDAALLQGLTVIFGAIGVLLLARRIGISYPFAFVAALAYSFNPGFFANAQHVDIVRAWAFLPWLILSLYEPKSLKPIHLFAFSVLWFQFFVGSYPGNIAAYAYIVVFWLVFLVAKSNRDNWKRQVFLPLIIVTSGMLMAMPKYLPVLLESEARNLASNQLIFNLGSFSTIFYPYSDPSLANDLTMRSFFIVPIFVFAIFLVKVRETLIVPFLGLAGLSLLLAVDTPDLFLKWQEQLPLLDLSRFRTADFRPGMSLGIILAGSIAIEKMARTDFANLPNRPSIIKLSVFGIAVLGTLALGPLAGLSQSTLIWGYLWLVASAGLTLFMATKFARLKKMPTVSKTRVPSGVVAVFVLAIGGSWALSQPISWLTEQGDTQRALFGKELRADKENSIYELKGGRPELVGPELPTTPGELLSVYWNGAAFERSFTYGGYVNLKGIPVWDRFSEFATSTNQEDLAHARLLAKSTRSWISADGSSEITAAECSRLNDCSDFEILNWGPGSVQVLAQLGEQTQVSINELNYPGWTASICAESDCFSASTANYPESFFVTAIVPAGDWTLKFKYQTPLRQEAWALFGIGALLALHLILAKAFRDVRRMVRKK